MSHIVDLAQGHKTRGIVAFFRVDFGLGASACLLGLAQPPVRYGSVGEEKELGDGTLPGPDARPSDA